MTRFNYTYKVPFEIVSDFEWTQRNDIVGYESYEERIMNRIPDIINVLKENKKSRHAVIVVNENEDHMSCLVSIQFQIHKKKLYVTGTFRSQHEVMGRGSDEVLMNYLATRIYWRFDIENVEIVVNVGNYHC